MVSVKSKFHVFFSKVLGYVLTLVLCVEQQRIVFKCLMCCDVCCTTMCAVQQAAAVGRVRWGRDAVTDMWRTVAVVSAVLLVSTSVHAQHYSSQWAVHIEGGNQVADAVAERNGFVNLGEIFPDYYHFEHKRIVKRSLKPSDEHHNNLLSEPNVRWAKQQTIRSRKKRDFLQPRDLGPEPLTILNDPRWQQMWYLNRGQGLDMSVRGAWKEGVTGNGVVVTILDDGLEKDHPDLIRNYDPQASYDVNNRDDDPMPRYDLIDSNRHGTRCAGEVAATANNSLCAVGIAFGANVGGVRMLDGDVTDAVEARSLSLNPQHIDIYSASWGPDDDGKTVDGPGELAMRAFIEGVTKGRGGRGSIFVWASGNGGRDQDNCNCDGYTNSIWTLSISSATENGLVPWYSEACSSTLATTYSSGSSGEKQVVTTDLHHQCTSSHTGTSASAPLAAGICALALEANRQLTWRDMQHIVVATARPANLKAPDWAVNGVGRNVSHSFGYGLMDATAMVQLARTWQTVPEQHKCEVPAPHINKPIPAKSSVTLKLNVKECPGVNYLEHVQAKITLTSLRRGDLQIHLTSPANTRATLLARRPHDVSRAGFDSWPFMSVHTWGETPFGTWELEIHNEGRYLGQLIDWQLIFYGTETAPQTSSLTPVPSVDQASTPTVVDPSPKKQYGSSSSSSSTSSASAPSSSSDDWKESSLHTKLISSDIEDELMENSVACKRSTKTCLECSPGLFLTEGRCEQTCPEGYYSDSPGHCNKCHYSCYQCSGPNDYQCSLCHGDAVLVNYTELESYCHPKSLLLAMDVSVWYYRACLGLVINIVLLLLLASYLYFQANGCKLGKPSHHQTASKQSLNKSTVIYDLANAETDSD